MTTRPGLGRIHVPDERDIRYPMRAIIEQARQTTAPRTRTARTWAPRAKPVLNQGQKPECVAYAFTAWYTDGPITHPHPLPYGEDALYQRAQVIDGIRGPHGGTTGRAAASVPSRARTCRSSSSCRRRRGRCRAGSRSRRRTSARCGSP